MTIYTSAGKGAPLTPAEADSNMEQFDIRTAQGWRDNIVQFEVDIGDVNAPVLNVMRGAIKAYTFVAGELTEANAFWHIDHDYALGTLLYPHVHWVCPSTEIGTVRWGFEYSIAKGHQQEAFPATTTIYVEQTTTGVAYMHYVGEVSEANAIDGALYGIEPDTIIAVRVFRDGLHANDTLADDVFGLCMDLHYQADHATTPNKSPPFV